jgi:hypothetical protein
MPASEAWGQRGPRRRLPLSEKRRLVELTLHDGASIRSVAREQGVNRTSLVRTGPLEYGSGSLLAAWSLWCDRFASYLGGRRWLAPRLRWEGALAYLLGAHQKRECFGLPGPYRGQAAWKRL